MAEAPDKKLIYTPKVTVYISSPGFQYEQTPIDIPIPEGQEWLYAMLENQGDDLKVIKRWITYFGIVSVIPLIGSVIYLLLHLFGWV